MFGTEILSCMRHQNLPETVIASGQQLYFFHLQMQISNHLQNTKSTSKGCFSGGEIWLHAPWRHKYSFSATVLRPESWWVWSGKQHSIRKEVFRFWMPVCCVWRKHWRQESPIRSEPQKRCAAPHHCRCRANLDLCSSLTNSRTTLAAFMSIGRIFTELTEIK